MTESDEEANAAPAGDLGGVGADRSRRVVDPWFCRSDGPERVLRGVPWEDGLFGTDRGDEVPEHLRTEEGRRAAFTARRSGWRRRLAATPSLRSRRSRSGRRRRRPRAVGGRRAWHRDAHKQPLRKREQDARPIARSRAERLLQTLHRLEENRQVEIQVNDAYERWQAERRAARVPGQRLGMAPKPFTPPPVPEGVMNKTDHDSRMMRTKGQPTVQDYNAQAGVTRGQIIVAAEIAVESPDFGHLEPAVAGRCWARPRFTSTAAGRSALFSSRTGG